MKKLLLAVGLIPVVSFGQITLNDTHFPVAGDQLVMSTTFDLTLDYMSTGANYTWDFSGLTPTGQRFTNYKDISDASFLANLFFGQFGAVPYQASYFAPTTDLPLDQITSVLPITIDDISLFSKSTPSALTMVGYEFQISGQGIPAKSDTIETRYEFPLNYGDAYTSRGYTDLDLNPIYDAKWIQHRYKESTVDGWGVITTPYGTFDALRIHHRVLENDSIYISLDTTGIWVGLPIPEAHEYEWRAAEEKEAILRVKTSVILGTETITSIEYRDTLNGLGLNEAELAFSVFPNPATDELTVLSTETVQLITILNQQGQVVKTIELNGAQPVIPVSDLDAGIYHLVVTTASGKATKLFAKQ
ncbi:MAG: T9SS type A sorting domain-containing protein [Fluviicola sp.]|nr:T9SS type A sorting domain-containing protein [Fluviicola sp.]